MNRKKALVPFLLLLAIVVLSIVFPAVSKTPADAPAGINSADTAWMLTAAALVLIMTPGLAFFYGGMVSKKNVISTMLQSFISMAVITILWVIVGFSLAFGDSFHGIIGNPGTFFLMKDMLN
ncbi:MAG TPA: ammonia channel protein, partial [Ferruginibacter sp.]|nr:ammonia channel protein [Ferruginibacter sp.]